MAGVTWWRELIAKIAEVPDDEFDERTEELSDLLDRAFETQRKGLTEKDSTKLLTDSLNQLKQWLSEPDNVGNPAGHYFAAYLNGYLGLSPLNLADIARPARRQLVLAVEVPPGGTLTKNEGNSMLVLPGIMAVFYVVDACSPPILGLLQELGEDGLRQHLIENGTSSSKAAKTVRDAIKAMKTTRVMIGSVCLGACHGKRYSYDMAIQRVHHYCLSLDNHNIHVTATEFRPSDSSVSVLERAIATIRIEPGR